jgi:flagellar export protein FliJ
MMGLHTLIRLRQQQLDVKRKALADLQRGLAMLNNEIRKLEAEVAREQETARDDPEASYLYGRYANAVITRRTEIEALIKKQTALVAEAHDEVMAAFRELKKLEVVQERREEQARQKALAAEQKSLDELGLDMHRRRRRG